MSLPIELDVSVGIHGQRVSWHYEGIQPISDENAVALVEAVKDSFFCFLRGLESPERENNNQSTGSVVSGEGEAGPTMPASPELHIEVGPPRGRPSKPRKPKQIEPWVETETREERLARIQRQREERLAAKLAG